MKKIGIIGGMGPLSTIDLFRKIVERTPAKKDQDHVPVLIANIPQVPDRTESILAGGKSPVPMIVESGKSLERAGADFLIIPCNTSHYYIEEIQKNLRVPVVNMIKLTADRAVELGYKKAAVLATEGTIKTGIYEKEMGSRGIDIIELSDDEISIVSDIIYKVVKANDFREIPEFKELCLRLVEKGAEVLVLGCTELPIVFQHYGLDFVTLDPTEVLAEAAIEISLGKDCLG